MLYPAKKLKVLNRKKILHLAVFSAASYACGRVLSSGE
jgi:hypothetical protein